jgi:hypothetical protein
VPPRLKRVEAEFFVERPTRPVSPRVPPVPGAPFGPAAPRPPESARAPSRPLEPWLESRRTTEEKGAFARRAASAPLEEPSRRMIAPAPAASTNARIQTRQVVRVVPVPSAGSGVRLEELRRFLRLATTGLGVGPAGREPVCFWCESRMTSLKITLRRDCDSWNPQRERFPASRWVCYPPVDGQRACRRRRG